MVVKAIANITNSVDDDNDDDDDHTNNDTRMVVLVVTGAGQLTFYPVLAF